jgi:DNA polymerase-3 subunit beta
VPADFSGDEPVIAFSPNYLLDGVIAATASAAPGGAGHVPDGTLVRLQFTSASKPAVITQGPSGDADAVSGFRYLVVPQRVQQ